MSGQHAVSGTRVPVAPPPPEVRRDDLPEMLIPQRERVTYLSHLATRLGMSMGLTSGIGFIDHTPVLNVIPIAWQGQPRRKAMTVGCHYDKQTGAWWFFRYDTGEAIAPANELVTAANTIIATIEETAAA